jgi:predicted ATP-grasp superfamily ATP-dependent carboligase
MSKVPTMVQDAVLNLKVDVEQLVKQSMKIATELPDLKQKG